MKKIEILSDSTFIENSLKETRLINYEKIKKVFSRILRELNDVERQKLTNILLIHRPLGYFQDNLLKLIN